MTESSRFISITNASLNMKSYMDIIIVTRKKEHLQGFWSEILKEDLACKSNTSKPTMKFSVPKVEKKALDIWSFWWRRFSMNKFTYERLHDKLQYLKPCNRFWNWSYKSRAFCLLYQCKQPHRETKKANREGMFEKKVKDFARYKLLIIDEMRYLPSDEEGEGETENKSWNFIHLILQRISIYLWFFSLR